MSISLYLISKTLEHRLWKVLSCFSASFLSIWKHCSFSNTLREKYWLHKMQLPAIIWRGQDRNQDLPGAVHGLAVMHLFWSLQFNFGALCFKREKRFCCQLYTQEDVFGCTVSTAVEYEFSHFPKLFLPHHEMQFVLGRNILPSHANM